MVTGTLICYTLGSNASKSDQSNLRRQLLGFKDFSNHKKYEYYREGLLDEIPCIRVIRSVFIIRNEDRDEVLRLLDMYDAKYFVREVILEKEDCHVLEIDETLDG